MAMPRGVVERGDAVEVLERLLEPPDVHQDVAELDLGLELSPASPVESASSRLLRPISSAAVELAADDQVGEQAGERREQLRDVADARADLPRALEVRLDLGVGPAAGRGQRDAGEHARGQLEAVALGALGQPLRERDRAAEVQVGLLVGRALQRAQRRREPEADRLAEALGRLEVPGEHLGLLVGDARPLDQQVGDLPVQLLMARAQQAVARGLADQRVAEHVRR